MALQYVVTKRVFGFDKTNTEKYVAKSVGSGKMNFDKMCEKVSRLCGIHRKVVDLVVSGLVDMMAEDIDDGKTGCEPCRRKFICLWRKLLVMLGGLWRALFAGRQSWHGKLTRRKCRCWRDTRWIIGQRRDSFWRCCIMQRILCTRKSKV